MLWLTLLTAISGACELDLPVEPAVLMGSELGGLPVDARAFARVSDDQSRSATLELLLDGDAVAGTPSQLDLQDGTAALGFRPDALLPVGVDVTARLTVSGEVVSELALYTEDRLADGVAPPRIDFFDVINLPELSSDGCPEGLREITVQLFTAGPMSDASVVEFYVVEPDGGPTGDPSVLWTVPAGSEGQLFHSYTTALPLDPLAEVCVVAIHVDAAGGRSAVTDPVCVDALNSGDVTLNNGGASCDYVGLTATPWAWLLVLFARRRKRRA